MTSGTGANPETLASCVDQIGYTLNLTYLSCRDSNLGMHLGGSNNMAKFKVGSIPTLDSKKKEPLRGATF